MILEYQKNEIAVSPPISNEEQLSAVIRLAETCNYDASHTHHVTHLALRLFDELSSLHHLTEPERTWLQYAALLHDIGWIEGQKSHHKASLRIILTTPLLPFDNKERLIIGSIARYHRKALPKLSHDHFASLTPEEQQIVRQLSALLRLADGLDSLHQSRVVNLTCKISRHQIKVTCLVKKVIPNESLVTAEKGDLLELVFQRKLVLVYKKIPNE
jgi:exopolyphosphatase/guanosine-5'-triphosphate,3'-diphosphate pyrophosphatase